MKPMSIPPKVLASLVQRTKTMDGCVLVSEGPLQIYEFAQNGTVITVIGDHSGYQMRDPHRAEEIRKILAARKKDPV